MKSKRFISAAAAAVISLAVCHADDFSFAESKWAADFRMANCWTKVSDGTTGNLPTSADDCFVTNKKTMATLPSSSATSQSDYVFPGKSLTVGSASNYGSLILYGPKVDFPRDGLKIVYMGSWNDNFVGNQSREGYNGYLVGVTNVSEISGTITFLNTAVNRAPFVLRRNDQHIRFYATLIGDSNSGAQFACTGGAGQGDTEYIATNAACVFLGDMTGFNGRLLFKEGISTSVGKTSGLPLPTIGAFGSSPCPGTVELQGANALLRTATTTNDAYLAHVILGANSCLNPEICVASPTCGTIRVTSTLSYTAPINVVARFLEEPIDFPGPERRYPILSCPVGGGNPTLDPDDFNIVLHGINRTDPSVFSIAVDVADGVQTLVLVKAFIDSPVKEVVPATWIGAATDDLTSSSGNWRNGLPDFTSGETQPTFAEGGSEALVSGAVSFNGIRFAGGDFTVGAAGAGSAIKLYAQGIATAEPTGGSAPVYTLSAPVNVYGDQTWNIAAGTTFSLISPLGVSGNSKYQIDVLGGGVCNWSASGSTFPGTLYSSNVVVNASGVNPFGAAGAPVVFNMLNSNSTYLRLGNFSTDKDIVLQGALTGSESTRMALTAGDVVFNGYFSNLVSRISVPQNTRLVLAGGAYASSFLPSGPGEIIITNKPLISAGNFQTDTPTTFAVSGNKAGGTFGLCMLYSSNRMLRMAVTNAVDGTVDLYMGGTGNIVDICGCDQTIGLLSMRPDGTGVITNSGAAAVLTVVQRKARASATAYPAFITGDLRGGISLVKSGEYMLAVSNTTITAVGSVTAVNGLLRFCSDASWPNATAVTVDGPSAVIEINNSATFPGDVPLALDNGGTIKVAAGVVQRVGSITIDGGRPLAPGLWRHGAAYSLADRTTPSITGDGGIYVPGAGTRIMFR